jgi:hypothetical protein
MGYASGSRTEALAAKAGGYEGTIRMNAGFELI